MQIRINPSFPDEQLIGVIANMAHLGQLVIFPTDTIYGIGTSSFSEGGVMSLFAAKRRSINKPLGIFMSSFDEVDQHCIVLPEHLGFLKSIWPGPVTCVLTRKPGSEVQTSPNKHQQSTIAVRIPSNRIDQILVEKLGCPMLQTSVNISSLPHQNYNFILNNYQRFADAMIDAGPESASVPSTVVDLSGEKVMLIREGSTPWISLVKKLEENDILVDM